MLNFRQAKTVARGAALMVTTVCLLAAANASAATQDDVFNPYCVSRIDITAPQTSLDALLIDPKGVYQPATMAVNVCGVEALPVKSITFRLKGSGSFRPLDGKAAFKIKMSSANRIDNLKSLTLNNMVQDESAIHESLAYRAFREVGVKAPRAGYAIVSINGVDYGLHANIESLDDRFLTAEYGTWKQLFEAADWIDFPSASHRDILPSGVPNFELEEKSPSTATDLTDLTALANISQIASDDDWWVSFQQKFDVTTVMRFFATEAYIGDWDGYYNDVNNYYLHSTPGGVFDFIPWGKDQTFVEHLPLDPGSANGKVFDRCVKVPACRTEFRSARNFVAETIIGLDLVEEAQLLMDSIATAVAADSRREHTVERQCDAANETVEFLIGREALWREQYRAANSGITSAQSSAPIQCDEPGPTGESAPAEASTPAVATVPPGVLINSGAKYTKSRAVSLALSWPSGSRKVEVSNDPQFAVARSFERSGTIAWTLSKLPAASRWRSVYVRFDGVGVAKDAIAIDDDAPVLTSVKIRASERSTKGHRYSLSVVARDSGSGADVVQVQTARGRKPFKRAYAGDALLSLTTRATELRVRVVDRAGNASNWKNVLLLN